MTAATDTLTDDLSGAAYLDMRRNPFAAAVVAGRCSRDAICRYAIGAWALSERFPQRLAAVASICEDSGVRLALLENLLEEEGVAAFEHGRLIRDDAKRHGNVALRFAVAAGATPAAMTAALERERSAAGWLDHAIAERRTAAALAYLTVGIESNVPATLTLIAESLSRHYGFGDRDLEFLTSHIAFDQAHGAAGVALTARLVRTDADRADALAGARRGALAWWAFHRSMLT